MEKIEVGNYVRARPSKRAKKHGGQEGIGGSIGLVRQLTETKKGPRALVLWPSGTDGLPHPFERLVDCELLVVCDLPRWMIPNDLVEAKPLAEEPEPAPARPHGWDTFSSAEGFTQGDRVRAGKGKRSEIGTIRWFVRVDDRWRALVGWTSDHTEQYVDLVKLHRVEPNFVVPEPEPEPAPEEFFDHDKCPGAPSKEGVLPGCGGDLRFDPDVVGNTCGGLTLRGWDVCTKCGSQWLARKGAVPYDAAWKLASGGRSVETGDGRIRVDGCSDTGALMARIAKLPELELEVARLRKEVKS